MATKRIVIIGGGFAGVKCAQVLRKELPVSEFEIVLFNRENHMVFHPMLAEVAGASLEPEDIAAPLRQMLPKVKCRTEDVLGIDLQAQEVEYEGEDERSHRLGYEHVVLACGAVANLADVPGMSDHAFPLKTIGDAMGLRAHVMRRLEKAEVCEDPERKRAYLSFIVIGGGFSGVEVAGELNELARSSCRYFSTIRHEDIRVTIVHSRDRVLPEMPDSLRDFAQKKIIQEGIDLVVNRRAKLVTGKGVALDNGDFISGTTVVSTVGTAMSPIIERLSVEKEKGRLVCEPDMRLKGFSNVWGIGDCARIPNAFDGQMSPPTGQFAERQGRQAAVNIARVLRGRPTMPFRHRPLGQLCSIGGHVGVAEFFGIKVSGFLAWFMWRGVYLMKLPHWSRRVKVGFDWAFNLFFFRDMTHMRPHETERVSRAFYQPGEYVFHQGDPGANFYVIESGEVEVLRSAAPGEKEELLAVLGPGSFFGEMALLYNRPRNASIRAKTLLEVIVMGRDVFTQVSKALTPLRRMLTEVVQQRTGQNWQNQPAVRSILGNANVESLSDASPDLTLSPDHSLVDVVRLFDEQHPDFCFVTSDGKKLEGVLTRTELLRAMEMGLGRNARVTEFMRVDPLVVFVGDSALEAIEIMRSGNISWLPVLSDRTERKIVGVLRSQKFVTHILMENVTRALPALPVQAGAD